MTKATETQNQENNVFEIPVSKLVKSPLNARKTAPKAACEELKASILSHGLMQNLIVTEGRNGKYEVVAGARRTEALKALMAEDKLPVDHAVLCQVVSVDHAYEMSLAENTVRHAMHPADEHAAFAVLIDGGKTVEDIAQRFGKTNKHVEQRLKLGRAAPELIQEYRDGKISLETLEAYAITDDRKRQIKVYESLKNDRWNKDDARHIRKLLTEKMVDARSKLATFIGLETYEKAGGSLKRDLFGEDIYLENPELLEALVEEKLKLVKAELEAEGWAWVEVAKEQDYSFTGNMKELEPEPVDAPQEMLDQKASIGAEIEAIEEEWEAADEEDDELLDSLNEKRDEAGNRLEEVEKKLASFVRFTPEQVKVAGCYAYIDHRGQMEIEKGLVRKEDAKKLPKAEAGEGDESEPEEKPKGLPESLKRDLAAYRLAAAQAEIAKHPALAFDLLVFKAAKAVCSISHAYDGPQVSFQQNSGGIGASGDARAFISEQMDAIEKGLPLDWQELDNEGDQFVAFQKLTDYQKQALLAYCVAVTLQPKLAVEGKPPSAYDMALAQTGANVATYWRPNAANYLSRVSKDDLLNLGEEIFEGSFAAQYSKAKKGELVALLDKGFADPEKALDPEKVRRLAAWLPAGMAFGEAPAEQKPAKSKKGKKAA